MQYSTWAELREKIQEEHDIVEEPDFLSEGELLGYVNDAIDVCEKHFIKLPDYFLASGSIYLVSGQRDYDLPEDMYATKIRGLWHDQDRYRVKLLKSISHKSLLEESPGATMKFLIINNSGELPKIRLFPTPNNTGNTLSIDYIRGASRLSGDDFEEIDIPEAMGFITSYVDMKLKQKEKLYGGPLEDAKAEMMRQEQLLIEALATRIDDEDATVIEPDVSIYEDHT
jgi:hypothetical protein